MQMMEDLDLCKVIFLCYSSLSTQVTATEN